MSPESIAALLEPYTAEAAGDHDWPQIRSKLTAYLDLILKWNARTNLTAIRTPDEIVRRHFGESLFAAVHLGAGNTLLDFGSGAGFPGIPIQLVRPDITVTLAESQGKKAAFLREAVRTLGLETEIWAARVESMPQGRQFDTVTLRAVDNMGLALAEASRRAARQIVILGGASSYPELSATFALAEKLRVPNTDNSYLLIFDRR